MSNFDVKRARLQKPDVFKRFRVQDEGSPLRDLGLDPSHFLLVFERAAERRALRADQMAYHHVAQGTLAGEPYLIDF
ncbi:MAG: hypothetical protein ACYTFT_09770 [Planctomycetota bacterium]|jgi:hypothetical protein